MGSIHSAPYRRNFVAMRKQLRHRRPPIAPATESERLLHHDGGSFFDLVDFCRNGPGSKGFSGVKLGDLETLLAWRLPTKMFDTFNSMLVSAAGSATGALVGGGGGAGGA